MIKRIFTFLAAALSSGALAYGCSNSDNSAADGGPDATGNTHDSSSSSSSSSSGGGDDTGTGDDSSTGNCSPADVSSWTPPAYTPAKSVPGACQGTDIDDFDTNCLAMGHTAANCTTWKSAHAACNSCLNSMSTDTTWGPVVQFGGLLNLNLGGCVELEEASTAEASTGDASASTCADALQIGNLCDHKACDTGCPVKDTATLMAWQNCQKAADQGGCMKYATATSCITSVPACDISMAASFDDAFKKVAPVFCGGGGDGGGTDAPNDAPPG